MQILVDELPKCCRKCVFCYDNRPYWKSTDCRFLKNELDEDEIETSRDKDCPLIDIKTHDRELVKEVCEKIYNDLKPHYGEEVSAVIIERVLSNLQKEFEK